MTLRGAAVVSLVLAVALASGCAILRPKPRVAPRDLTRRPDPDVPCACRMLPKRLRFTGVSSVAVCGVGAARSDPRPALACGTLYVGGGAPHAPAMQLHGVDAVFSALACNDETVFLGGAAKGATGGVGTCTTRRCPFGAPAASPDLADPKASTCTVLEIAEDPVGIVDCRSGDGGIRIPLLAHTYATGDLLPRMAGLQPCPLCTGPAGRRTCKGGARNGKRCVPTGGPAEDGLATSTDCPPDRRHYRGTVTMPLVLDTRTQTATAAGGGAPPVFCGFCRDEDGDGAFEGAAAGAARACTSDADCAQPFERCTQRTVGALRRGDATATTASGAAASGLEDGAPHPATLAAVFCVPPTFDPKLDAAFDLPGPAAAALPGMMQLQ